MKMDFRNELSLEIDHRRYMFSGIFFVICTLTCFEHKK